MKSVDTDKLTIRFYKDFSDWSLPVRLSFGKKLVSVQILFIMIEFDWINEEDVVTIMDEDDERQDEQP